MSDAPKQAPRMGEPGYFPNHRAERRVELASTTPAQRVAEAIRLSRAVTRLAVSGRRAQ